MQRLRPATLADGVFGPDLDQKDSTGVPEDALLLEAFHDGGSGKIFLEATPADSTEPCMMQHEVLGYMRELAREVVLPSGCGEAVLEAQLKAMKARAAVMMKSDVEDARYDYEQRQLNYVMGERMCMQAWANLAWLYEYGIALEDGEEWLLNPRGVAGAVKPTLDDDGGEEEFVWAPKVKPTEWDFPSENIAGNELNGFTSSLLKVYRLSISQGSMRFSEPGMGSKLSMVAGDTLRLMLIIFEVLGDSIVGMSQPGTARDAVSAAAAAKQRAAAERPASAPTRSKKKGKNKKRANQPAELSAAELAELAEINRLSKVKALQRRFVRLHVAEKTRSRKDYILSLYADSTDEERGANRTAGQVVSAEEAAEIAVIGGKREIVMHAHGNSQGLLRTRSASSLPGPSEAELREQLEERLSMLSKIVKASNEVGEAADTNPVLDSIASRAKDAKVFESSGSGSDYLQPEEADDQPDGRLKLHNDTAERIKAMSLEAMSSESLDEQAGGGGGDGSGGGGRAGGGGGGGGGGKQKRGGSKKQNGSAQYKLSVLPTSQRW